MTKLYNKAIFFAPGAESFFEDWEWYKSDRSVLEEVAKEVCVCFTLVQFLRALRGTTFVYCSWWHSSVGVIIICKALRIPVVVTGALHMFDPTGVRHYYSGSGLYKLCNQIGLQFADANLFISKDQYETVARNLRVNNPHIVYSSFCKKQISKKDVLKARQKRKRQATTPFMIITVLWQTDDQITRKGLWESLDGIQRLRSSAKKPFVWYIVGREGGGTKKIAEVVKNSGLNDCVKVLNDISADEKLALFFEAEIYLQPSWCEGLGWAVVEAASCGCIPVVSRYAAQPETVPSLQFVADPLDGKGIGDKLTEIINGLEEYRELLSVESMDFVHSKFSFHKHVNSLRCVLKELGVKN